MWNIECIYILQINKKWLISHIDCLYKTTYYIISTTIRENFNMTWPCYWISLYNWINSSYQRFISILFVIHFNILGSATRTNKAVDKHTGPLFPPAETTPCKVVFPFLSVNTNGPKTQNKTSNYCVICKGL